MKEVITLANGDWGVTLNGVLIKRFKTNEQAWRFYDLHDKDELDAIERYNRIRRVFSGDLEYPWSDGRR